MLDKNYFPGSKLHIRCPRHKGQSLSLLSHPCSLSVIHEAVRMRTVPPAFISQLQSYTGVFSARGRSHVQRQMHHFKMKLGWLSSRILWFNLGSRGLPRAVK